MGAPAFRAALVSIVMIASALCWRMAVLKALTAPLGPLSSSSGITSSFRPSTPPLALISSAASSPDCTTAGATTLLTPLRPTGTAMTIAFLSAESTVPADESAAPSTTSRTARDRTPRALRTVSILVPPPGEGVPLLTAAPSGPSALDHKVPLDALPRAFVRRLSRLHHRSDLQNGVPVGDGQGEANVLLDDHDGDAFCPTLLGQNALEPRDHRRLESLGDLVHQDHARPGQE